MRTWSDIFKALADPTRRAILDELHERDGQTLFELCARLTMKHGLGVDRQAISQHLDVLEVGRSRDHRGGRADTSSTTSTPRRSRHIAERWPSPRRKEPTMRISVTSVLVDDQDKALAVLHGRPRLREEDRDPDGGVRWLTVVSPDDPDGTELLLEPDGHPAAKPFKAGAGRRTASRSRRSRVDDVARGVRAAPRRGRPVHPAADRRWARSRPPSSTTRAAT